MPNGVGHNLHVYQQVGLNNKTVEPGPSEIASYKCITCLPTDTAYVIVSLSLHILFQNIEKLY